MNILADRSSHAANIFIETISNTTETYFFEIFMKEYAVDQNSDGSRGLQHISMSFDPISSKESPTPTISVTKMSLVYLLLLIGSTLISVAFDMLF